MEATGKVEPDVGWVHQPLERTQFQRGDVGSTWVPLGFVAVELKDGAALVTFGLWLVDL